MIMYFTSGTSGDPKMVLHDYTYALAHLTTAAYWHNVREDSLHLTVADTGWGKAVWGKLYGQWIVGAAVFTYDHETFRPVDILRKMERYHVTSFCAPPTIYRYLVREDLTKYDLSALCYVTTAGEALNPSVSEKFYQLMGLRIHEGFGQTETTCTLGTFKWMNVKPGSMGKPNPQYDIHLMTDGKETPVGEVGEIVVRTSERVPLGLFSMYYRNEELTREVWHDGFYHTGDLAYKDEDGYYWYVGRHDDVIKSAGYRIGPFEVESALMTHPAVIECAVTAVPDEQRGQGYGDHTAAHIDIKGLLLLGHQAAGQRREGVGDAQAHGGGEGGIDGGGAHHVRVIARCPDGEPQPRAQKQRKKHDHRQRPSGHRHSVQ